jgi:small subunit ribosomal protein S16
VALNTDRANYWLDNGAQASDTVRSLLRRAGVLKARHEARLGAKLTAAAVPLAERKSE